MRIQYKDADGRVLELEVSEEVGRFYLADLDRESKSDRRETRRHTPLSAFSYEDARYFSDNAELLEGLAARESVRNAISHLTPRQRELICKTVLEGWSYAELAAREGKDESAIRHAVKRAKEKLKKISDDRPVLPSPVAYSEGTRKRPSERRERHGTHASNRRGEKAAGGRPGSGGADRQLPQGDPPGAAAPAAPGHAAAADNPGARRQRKDAVHHRGRKVHR